MVRVARSYTVPSLTAFIADPTVTLLQGAGIDLTGVADSTGAVAAIVASATGPVFGVPGAIYKVANVALKTGSDVRANGASIICTAPTPAVAGEGGGAFVATNLTNVAVSGWTASGNAGTSLLKVVASTVVDCMRNTVTTMQVFQCNSANGNIYVGSSETENVDILVQGNRCSGPAVAVGTAGIFLLYCSDVRVIDNKIAGYTSGVQYWGGDANSQGAIGNPRKCKRVWMSRNRATGAYGGGLWGSMGEDVRIHDNYVANNGDIGIDFEGSFYCRATKNTVVDSFVGCYGTFFICRDVVFDGNTAIATSTATCAALFILKNATSDASTATGNGTITVTNSTGYYISGVSFGVFAEACEHLVITNNRFRNCKLWSNLANTHHMTIVGNQMRWEGAASVFTAIEVGGNVQSGDGFPPIVTITDNRLVAEVPNSAGSRGIYSTQADPNSSPVVEIHRNHIYGFASDIISQWGGPNAGTAAVVRISDNICFNSISSTNTGAASPQNLRTWGNRRAFTGLTVAGGASLTVTGSRGANAAVASLITQLAALGLVVDGSTA